MIKIEMNVVSASFVPGQSISGTVYWEDEQTESFDIRLIWYTSGKGDRDYEVVASNNIDSPMHGRKEKKFSFVAPDYPSSFSGKLISLIWAVEVILFPSREAENKVIIISPSGNEILIGDPTTIDD